MTADAAFPETVPMPALFVGHGSPMNAIEDNEFSRAWTQAGETLPRPAAILCISAHWETAGTRVTAEAQPRTIHDFGGFPAPLYALAYPAPGSPALSRLVQATVAPIKLQGDTAWGLDHGAWSVLRRLFPHADVPVVQLSLDYSQPPAYHYALARALQPLRRRGVLIVGSGNVVHNLRLARWDDFAYPWATEFDATVRDLIVSGQDDPLIDYASLGDAARLAVPSNEHFLPLLYVLGVREAGEPVSFFAAHVTMGSISMRSLRIG